MSQAPRSGCAAQAHRRTSMTPTQRPGGAISVWKRSRTTRDRSLAFGTVTFRTAWNSGCSFLWADTASWVPRRVPAQWGELNWEMKTTRAHTVWPGTPSVRTSQCQNAGGAGRFWKLPRQEPQHEDARAMWTGTVIYRGLDLASSVTAWVCRVLWEPDTGHGGR